MNSFNQDEAHNADNERAQRPQHQPMFNIHIVVMVIIGACVAIHLVRNYLLTPDQDLWVIIYGAFIPMRYSSELVHFSSSLDWLAALLTPITYSFLHGGWAHLIFNSVWLAAFGSPLAVRLGSFKFCLFWASCAIAAAGLHYCFNADSPVAMIGASGAISGMMAAAARFGFNVDKRHRPSSFSGRILPIQTMFFSKTIMMFLGVWFAMNIAIGLGITSPDGENVAWLAHIGGFICGFFILPFLDNNRPIERNNMER